jgi:hypothetical protein
MKLNLTTILLLVVFAGCELEQSTSFDRQSTPPVVIDARITPVFINIAAFRALPVIDTVITVVATLDAPSPFTTTVLYEIFDPEGILTFAGTLSDNGIAPDLTSSDGIYTATVRISISSNTIGTFSVVIFARNTENEQSILFSLPLTVFNSSNSQPVLSSLFAPDTVIVPSGNDVRMVKVSISAADSQGLNDIVSVSLRSLRPDLTVAGLFPMYDDGGTIVQPTFNISSGDSLARDGRYTLTIPIFSSTQKNTFRDFIFTATDRSNAVSAPVMKRVYIQ